MSDLNVYTTSAINALTPITGDMVIDSDLNAVKLYDGAAWRTWNSDSVAVPYQNRWGASFDGIDDAVLLGDSSTTLFNYGTADFTMSIWFKPNASANYDTLWSGHLSSGGGWLMYLGNSNVFGFYGDQTSLKSAGTVNLNAWNHGAVIRTSTTLKLYLNGDKILDDTIASSDTFNKASSITVGMGSTGSNSAYDGEVDEAAVWLSALSDGGVSVGSTAGGDIEDIYNGGVPNDLGTDGLNLSPIGWWRMGDDSNDTATSGGSIATITDSSGNGNDATQSTASNQPTFSDLTGETIYV